MSTEQESRKRVVPKLGMAAPNWFFTLLVVTSFSLVLCAAWNLTGFGSIREAVRYSMAGQTLLVDSTAKSFGTLAPRDEVRVSFRLTNRGRGQIRIVGCQSYCNCTLPEDLPFVLEPDETREFVLLIRAPGPQFAKAGTSGRLELRMVLFTNNPFQSRIPLLISGNVRQNPAQTNPGS